MSESTGQQLNHVLRQLCAIHFVRTQGARCETTRDDTVTENQRIMRTYRAITRLKKLSP